MYEIRYIGDPILRITAEKIENFNGEIKKFIKDMFEIMHHADGVGLAAPQIGLSKSIMVVDISPVQEKSEPKAFINPQIVSVAGEKTMEEGCISIPNVREKVTRPEQIILIYQNEQGESMNESFDGWMARVLQHEIDHLNGVMFVDHLSPVKRQMLISQNLIPERY